LAAEAGISCLGSRLSGAAPARSSEAARDAVAVDLVSKTLSIGLKDMAGDLLPGS